MRSKLSICSFIRYKSLGDRLDRYLEGDRYSHTQVSSEEDFLQHLDRLRQQIDCLVLQQGDHLRELLRKLRQQKAFLPMVVVRESVFSQNTVKVNPDHQETIESSESSQIKGIAQLYHGAVLEVSEDRLSSLSLVIEEAIANFLKLSTTDRSNSRPQSNPVEAIATQDSLQRQQQRLAEKLKERLGYLGVYYKRDPKNFFRRLSHENQQQLLNQLKEDYQEIILNYFSDNESLNSKIDDFINIAFFSDISVSQLVEIHMELMEEYSKQLQLEGRSEEILLDYRLTLIDTIAHLCEMYRRSIPREA